MEDPPAIEFYLRDICDALDSINTSMTIIAMAQQQRNIPSYMDEKALVVATEKLRTIAEDLA